MGTAIGDIVTRENISLDHLNGKTLGFDAYNIIYQFLSSIRGPDGTPLRDSKGNVTSHLTGLFYRTINLVDRGVKPVFVFDGVPSDLKAETIRKRIEIRTAATKKHEEALKKGDLEEAKKFGSRALKLERGMVDDAKELLTLMGFPVVQATSDGESQIVAMVQDNKLDGCVSQDYDALLFGATILYRNIGVTGKRKVPGKNIYVDVEPEKIVLEQVLSENKLTRQKLVWIGILIGTDFNEKFPKVGIKTALKLVQGNDTFEGIIKETGYKPDFNYKNVESIFLNPNVTKDYSTKFSLPQKDKIIEFLCGKHDFSTDRVSNAVNRLYEKLNEKTKQSNLGDWI